MAALTIDQHILPDGTRAETCLEAIDEGRALRLRVGTDVDVELPVALVQQVMLRYAKPLAEGIVCDGPRLELAGGLALIMLRHRARYDVIARDFLVLMQPGEPPRAELSTAIAAALTHFAKLAK